MKYYSVERSEEVYFKRAESIFDPNEVYGVGSISRSTLMVTPHNNYKLDVEM